MTVSSTTVKNSYSGNGSTTQFAYGYKIFADSDLIVIIRTDSTGVETVKTLTTHYTVAGAGDASGGSITFTSGNTPASGETVVIIREVPQTQAIDYIANDPFPAESHEEGLDRATMTTQQVQEEVDRSLKISRTNTMTSTEFTTSATDRANKVLSFDGSGELAVTQELGTYKGTDATVTTAAYNVRDIIKSTTSAQLNNVYICVADSVVGDSLTDTDHFELLVDAVSAATSATASATSATASASSATASASSASTASTQASNAATSATASANSATAAATSATEAAASADAFDDIYLGSKSSDPSTDNDGDALAAGMLYFNTTNDILRVYSGSAWQDAAISSTGVVTLTGTQTLTNKTLTTPKIAEIDSLSSGDITIDADGDINLDAGGADINFKDDGTKFGHVKQSSSNMYIQVESQDKDIHFRGNDNGSIFNAAILDMSDAGTLVLNHDIRIADGGKIGSASDADAIAIASNGALTINGAYTFPTSDGSANQVLKTDGSGSLSFSTASSVAGAKANRNIIINGDMSISQRATSKASITSGDYHTLDRFKTFINNTAGTWTQSQSTTVPTGQGFAKSLKMDCTTAKGSLSSGDILTVRQAFEGQSLQYLKKGTSSAESLTASFWVRSSKTGTYVVELEDRDNTRYVSQSYTISSADTWEKKTVTFPGDTSGAFGNDHDESLRFNFWLVAGTNYTSGTLGTTWHTTNANRAVGIVNLADSTSNEWYVTGVQLEAGTSASDFEFIPPDINLQRCQRYCYAVNGIASDETGLAASGLATSTSTLKISLNFPVPMRAYPSVSEAGLQANIVGGAQDVSLASVQDNANSTFNPSNITVNLTPDSGTPFTAGHSLVLRLDNATSANLKIDAEL